MKLITRPVALVKVAAMHLRVAVSVANTPEVNVCMEPTLLDAPATNIPVAIVIVKNVVPTVDIVVRKRKKTFWMWNHHRILFLGNVAMDIEKVQNVKNVFQDITAVRVKHVLDLLVSEKNVLYFMFFLFQFFLFCFFVFFLFSFYFLIFVE